MAKKKSSNKNLKKQDVSSISKVAPPHLKDKAHVSLLRRFMMPVIILLTIISFLSVKDLGFVNWDDPAYVLDNAYRTLSAENIKTAFLAGIHPDYPSGIATNYHPLTMISLMINHSMSGLNPSSYHWTNLFLHLINVVLSYLFFLLLFGKKNWILAGVGALVFAIHPMHVESVAWISERKDVLFMLFYLLGMNQYLRYKDKQASIWPVYVYFLLSLLSKPSAVTFPIALMLIDYLKDSTFSPKVILNKIPLLLLSVVFGMITIGIQGDVAVGDLDRFSLLEKLSFASYGLVYYISKFISLTQSTAFHPYPGPGHLTLLMSISPLIIAAVIAGVVVLFRKNKFLVFGLLFFILNLALTLQFVQVGPSVVSDRYTYLSYHGLITILLAGMAYVITNKPQQKKIVYSLIGLWSLLMMYRTHQQVQTWQNSEILWNNVLHQYPGSHYAYKGRAEHYYDEGKYEKALIDIDKALEKYDNQHLLHAIKGNALRRLGKNKEALLSLNKAITLEPTDADNYNSRANAYIRDNQSTKALADYEKCLTLNPSHKEALGNIGAYYFNIKDYKTAIEKYTQAIAKIKDQPLNYLNRAGIYLSDGQYPRCVEDINTYLSKAEPLAKAYYFKALALEELKKIPAAIEQIDLALRMDPRNQEYNNTKNRLSRG